MSFTTLIWWLPIAIALHELEEWNIIGWYDRNFIDLPYKTKTSTRVFLVFMSLLGFVWTALALIPNDRRISAIIIYILAVVVFLNAIQHIYWQIYFREYAPGVITAVLLIIPIVIAFTWQSLQYGYLSIWYVIILGALGITPGLKQTIRAGNRMTAMFVLINRFGVWLARTLKRERRDHE